MSDTTEIRIVRDFDRKWVARWPADLVAAGDSPGAGRHDRRSDLIDAIAVRGWTVEQVDGERWSARRGPSYGSRDLDLPTLARQIGRMNVMAISGGRVETLYLAGRRVGMRLPVSHGYTVDVLYADDDTYTVRRTFRRGGREWTKGETRGVYAEQVGEIAYAASCFRNVEFPDGAYSVAD